jgi:hypothetical protein
MKKFMIGAAIGAILTYVGHRNVVASLNRAYPEKKES